MLLCCCAVVVLVVPVCSDSSCLVIQERDEADFKKVHDVQPQLLLLQHNSSLLLHGLPAFCCIENQQSNS